MKLSELLAQKPTILLDGAMGTELANNGVDISLPLWSTNALMKAPQIVRNIHSEYLRAGADIITTNTFRSNKRTIERSEYADRWESLNRVSVELAFEARERYPIYRPVLIAGSLAPVEDCYSPELVPDETVLFEEHSEQAELIAQLGVDFLLAETLITINEAKAVARACSATGKEFALSFYCKDEHHLLSGESLSDAIKEVEPYNPTALLVNCIAFDTIHRAFKTLRTSTDSIVGCYANTGNPTENDNEPQTEPDIRTFVTHAESWVKSGARIIGGCCGTTPDYIYELSKMLRLRSKVEV